MFHSANNCNYQHNCKKGRYCGGLSKHIFPNQLKAWLFRILSATLIKTWLPRLKIEKRQKLFSNRPNCPPSPHIAPQVHSHALISTETTPLSPNLRRRYIVIEKPLMTIMPIKISTSKTYFCCQLIVVHLFCGQARHFSGFKTRQFCQSWGLVWARGTTSPRKNAFETDLGYRPIWSWRTYICEATRHQSFCYCGQMY